jgi:hypothetical protein
LAQRGDHYKAFGFWEGFEKLPELTEGWTPTFRELAECASKTVGDYKTFCDQTHLISNEGKFDYKHGGATGPLWEDWRTKHNALVDEYEKAKRDPRLGILLFRPARENPLGEIIGVG